MCTLTWWRDESDRLEIFFNRDEKKDRPVAEPPTVRELDGVSFLSPRDPEGGGTWMFVNEHGFVVCLLNKWDREGRTKSATKSRGQLVLRMAGIKSLNEVEGFLHDFQDYPAFTLVVFTEENHVAWEWDGESLFQKPITIPMTSSSFSYEEVRAAREKALVTKNRGGIYHASEGQECSAYTVRMNRPDAQTWSRSRVVLGDEIVWEYLAEQADLVGAPEKTVVVLPRR